MESQKQPNVPQESVIKYSWGELYETLKEMQRNGDETKDPFLLRMINLFDRLNSVNTIEELRSILEKEKFTEYEQNRINSRCLDGILLTFMKEDIPESLVKNYTEYIDAILYYINRGLINKRHLCMYAAKFGKNEFAKFILERDIITSSDDLHCFMGAIILSCETLPQNIETSKILLQKGVNLNNRNFYKFVTARCVINNISMVKFLIELGIDDYFVNTAFLRFTVENPLSTYRCFTHEEKVPIIGQTLEEIKSAPIEHTREKVGQFLEKLDTWEQKRVEFVRYLLDNGADVHIDNDDAISQSAIDGKISMVRLLLEYGADPEAALQWEIENEEIEELLQEAAAQRAILPEN